MRTISQGGCVVLTQGWTYLQHLKELSPGQTFVQCKEPGHFVCILMGHNGGKLAMEMGREPVVGLDSVHDVPGWRGAQPVLLNVRPEVLLESEQPVHVPIVGHTIGPVVTQHNIRRMVCQLLQSDQINI